MLPIQFILLLILVSMPGGMVLPGAQSASAPPWLLLGWLLLSQIGLVIFVWSRVRKAIRLLNDPSTTSSAAITQGTDTLFSWSRWFSTGITAVFLFTTPLGAQIFHWIDHLPGLAPFKGLDGHVSMVPELIFMAPAMGAWVAIWLAAYFVEEASHERRLPYELGNERPVHELPTAGQYIVMQMRHNFFPIVFLPMQAAVAVIGSLATRWFPHAHDRQLIDMQAEGIASVVFLGGLLLVLPWLLVRLWSTTPLVGPLRQRLDGVAGLYRIRFRNILLWRTHNLVINAAILGWIPFARYFLMSDSLLEMISDRQLEAVFAHEVGHGVHKHIPWYFALLVGAMALAVGICGILVYALHLPENGNLAQFLLVALACICGGLTMPLVAPRFEHQADWFAARHMARVYRERAAESRESARVPAKVQQADAPEWRPAAESGAAEMVTLEQYVAGLYPHAAPHARVAGATPAGESAAQPAALIETPDAAGAEIFISALDSIIETSNRSRNRRGWMHPSPNQRAQLLRELATNPAAVKRFDRWMRNTRLLIVGVALLGIASSAVAFYLPPQDSPATQPVSTTHAAIHPK